MRQASFRLMRLKEHLEQGVEVLAFAGEVDLLYLPVLRTLLRQKLVCRCPLLLLDLAELEFIDSSGLAAFMGYHRDASAQHDGVLCLTTLNPAVRPIFDIVQFDRVIPIYPTNDLAIAAWKNGDLKPCRLRGMGKA